QMSSSSSIWLITVDIYHWFFANLHNKILQLDYSSLDNIEGDLDLSLILDKSVEHENLNIRGFEDFIELNLDEIELFIRENGRMHGMVVTVHQAKEHNYHIININNDQSTMVWKVSYNIRFLDCISNNNLPNLYDVQQNTRSNYIWQICAQQEHKVYQYIFKNLDQFHIRNLPALMNRTQEDLIKMVEQPLEQTDHKIISDMIDIQCCKIRDLHQHNESEQLKYVILVEPSSNLLDIINI
ncbi:unnamed protein product, partial [Rotaria sp. Silwood2]